MPRTAHRTAPGRRRTALTGVLTALLLVGVLGGMWWGYGRLEARVGTAHRVEPRVVIHWPALGAATGEADGEADEAGQPRTWMSEGYRVPVAALVRSALTDDPYDRGALERAAEALRSTGWVRTVRSITREPGGVVRVKAEWRVPAAVVRYRDRDYLVSAEGELLPPVYRAGSTGFRAIVNVKHGPPARAGEMWPGGDVPAGLALLGQLQRSARVYAQVSGIDVEKYATSRRLAAVTDRGTLVVWGVPPGETRVGEPSAAAKMALLEGLVGDAGLGHRIDAGQPLVDVSSPAGILIDASARPTSEGPKEPLGEGRATGGVEAGTVEVARAKREAGVGAGPG